MSNTLLSIYKIVVVANENMESDGTYQLLRMPFELPAQHPAWNESGKTLLSVVPAIARAGGSGHSRQGKGRNLLSIYE